MVPNQMSTRSLRPNANSFLKKKKRREKGEERSEGREGRWDGGSGAWATSLPCAFLAVPSSPFLFDRQARQQSIFFSGQSEADVMAVIGKEPKGRSSIVSGNE